MSLDKILAKHVGKAGGAFSAAVTLVATGASYFVRTKNFQNASVTAAALSALTGLLAGASAASLCMTASYICSDSDKEKDRDIKAIALGTISFFTGAVAALSSRAAKV